MHAVIYYFIISVKHNYRFFSPNKTWTLINSYPPCQPKTQKISPSKILFPVHCTQARSSSGSHRVPPLLPRRETDYTRGSFVCSVGTCPSISSLTSIVSCARERVGLFLGDKGDTRDTVRGVCFSNTSGSRGSGLGKSQKKQDPAPPGRPRSSRRAPLPLLLPLRHRRRRPPGKARAVPPPAALPLPACLAGRRGDLPVRWRCVDRQRSGDGGAPAGAQLGVARW
jgi:hypothetical protein